MAIVLDLPATLIILILYVIIIILCLAAAKKAGDFRRELRKKEGLLDPNEILVAGLFGKEKLERILGKQLTDVKYREIIEEWNKGGAFKKVTQVVSEWIKDVT